MYKCVQKKLCTLQIFKIKNFRLSEIITIPFEIEDAGARILRRLSYILQLCKAHYCFDMLPVEHDSLIGKYSHK